MKTKALVAGSFDPVTLGHIDIIKRASTQFDELVVAVVVNPNKSCLFTLEERKKLLLESTAEIPNLRIDSFDGLLANYVNSNCFTTVIKGLRNNSDFEFEQQMSYTNDNLFDDNIETVFFMTSPDYSYISSSMVREVASLGGDISNFVPECVEKAIQCKLRRK